jgi:dihydrofolate reductase
MRKIVAGFASSVDGYIEAADGSFDWIIVNSEIDFADQMRRYDTFLYGRKTYELVVKSSDKLQAGSKHVVFSKTIDKVAQGFTLVRENIKEKVLEMKREPGKDIALFGGASLLATLLDLKLVDKISISMTPVLLGAGKPMVDILKNRTWLKLEKTHAYSNGTVQLTYAVTYDRVV